MLLLLFLRHREVCFYSSGGKCSPNFMKLSRFHVTVAPAQMLLTHHDHTSTLLLCSMKSSIILISITSMRGRLLCWSTLRLMYTRLGLIVCTIALPRPRRRSKHPLKASDDQTRTRVHAFCSKRNRTNTGAWSVGPEIPLL